MQSRSSLALMAMALGAMVRAEEVNPMGKALELLTELQAKVTADGIAEEKAYRAFADWCEETTQNQRFEIKTAKAKIEKLEATINKADADIEATTGKIEDLAGKIGNAQKELKDATEIRDKEAADFAAAEATLMENVDALTRAIAIIEKEMAKNPAAFVQTDGSSLDNLVNALATINDAAGLDTATTQKLVAFAQQQVNSEDEADGAPDPAAYKAHSGGILDVLEELKTKAEEELSALRKAETNNEQNYRLLKGSLEDELAFNSKEKKMAEAFKSDCEETKATSTADLDKTKKLLEETENGLEQNQNDCMKTAEDHDESLKGRAEELKVLEEAKKILQDTSSGAVADTYGFIQVSQRTRMRTRADLKSAELVGFLKKLARDEHSQGLFQLASRVAALSQFGARNGEDPFAKVTELIKGMIAKLEAQAKAAADEKAYCDEQMSKTEAKKSDLEDDIAKLTAKVDKKSAQSAELKEDVKELQAELAALAKEQSELDKVRAENKAAFEDAKANLELGLEGLNRAIKKLRKYYQGGDSLVQTDQPAKPIPFKKAEGAGGSIIDILEVCESDFAKELSTITTEETDQVEAYEKRTQEIKEAIALKSKSVTYKVQEFKGLDKEVNELTEDRASTDAELQAVNEYFGKVKERCVAKPETYEERKKRREAEIAGLKQALEILENDAAPEALIQAASRRHRRGHSLLRAR